MTKHYSSKPCKLLSAPQNQNVFNTLRPNSTALVTTVAILYYNKDQKWTRQYFGILCIERDSRIKRYFLRFYDMQGLTLMIQQKLNKNFRKSFIVLRELFFQMMIHDRLIGFEFIDTPAGWEESYNVMKALRGNTKKLKREAETRYYEEHPEKQKESRFKRLFRWKNNESQSELPTRDVSQPSSLPCIPYDVLRDPGVRTMLNNMGIDADEALQTEEGRREVERFIEDYGGPSKFKELIIEHGFVRGLGKSTESQTNQPPNSVPITPSKVALDAIARFEPAKQVKPERQVFESNYEDFCMGYSKEEDLYQPDCNEPSIPPIKNLTTLPTKKATSLSPKKPETPEKVRKSLLDEAMETLGTIGFVIQVNKLGQRLHLILKKVKTEGKGKHVQEAVDKDKKGQAKEKVISGTTEESTGTTTSDSDSDEDEKE